MKTVLVQFKNPFDRLLQLLQFEKKIQLILIPFTIL
jgi:hypothetical protein